MRSVGLEASELAQRADVNETHVKALLASDESISPSMGALESIAIALNCGVADLVAGWPPPAPIIPIVGATGVFKTRDEALRVTGQLADELRGR